MKSSPTIPQAKTARKPIALAADRQASALLSARQEAFALAIAKGANQSDAFRQAYPNSAAWAAQTVHSRASRLASSDKVRARIAELLQGAAKANEIEVAEVLRQYLMRLHADPRQLVEVHVGACRHCWGRWNRYQFTDGELEDARSKHELKREELLAGDRGRDIGEFDERGGGGYSFAKAPNQECPTCAGAGEARAVLKDSRSYDAAALSLFDGVKETKDGIEVKVADRSKALEQVARHIGFFEKDKEKATGTFDPVALGAAFGAAMQRSAEGQAQIEAERRQD